MPPRKPTPSEPEPFEARVAAMEAAAEELLRRVVALESAVIDLKRAVGLRK